MKRNVILKSIFTLITVFSVLFTSCDSWMSDDDDFYKEIEEEVRVANATEISTFVRFAATREGITTPSGASTVKVEVPFQVSCTAELEYAFYKWAAFSSEGTNGFSTSSQHTNFFYVDDEDYLANYADKELPESVVSFSNPTDTTTKVTIHEARNDIFIIPVVANRPIVSTSLPSPGQRDVVRNMTIRIVFSKPMDASTLMVPYDSDNDGEFDDADGDGEPDEYRLSENIIVYKSTGDFDNLTLTDITDEYTNVSLGATKKTLSFRQGAGIQLDSNTTIQVQILSDVKDACGYTMADKHTLQFVTGNSSDSQAPRVEKLYAGPTAQALSSTSTSWGSNQRYNASDEYTTYFVPAVENQSSSYVGITGSSTVGDTSNISFTSQILTHRTKGPVYIYAYARDTSENNSAGLESDVYQLYIRATHLVYPDASLVSEENVTSLARTASAYNPGGHATGVERTVSSDLGYEFKYDVSDLPDGLIRIDVAAVDTIGNDGFSTACVNAATNWNYYKSIYVVKDTTAPNSDVEKDKVTSAEVSSAPYHWFNESSIADLKIQQTSYATNPLVDRYDQNLASPYDKLSWCFSLDGGENWTNWAYVTTDYSITNAAEIAQDGVVLINYKLKDDLGNESEIQTLNSITYDNTRPVVDELKWIANANDASSDRVLGATRDGILPVLRVPFTEGMSGIKKPVITIVQIEGTANGTAASAEYRYESETVENEEVPVTNDSNNGIVFSDTTAKYKTGYFTISNLNLGSNEGQYAISVNLMDQAMNTASVAKVINAIKDATPPVINTIKIVDLKKVEYADNSTSSVKYFAPYSAIHPDESGEKYADTLTLEYDITEAGTGVQEISLGGSTFLTAASRLQTQENGSWVDYENAEDITYNVTDNKITFVNYDTPHLKGENIKFRITNVKFAYRGVTDYNTIESSLKDFVNQSSTSPKTSFTYEDSSTTNAVDRVYVDVAAPLFAETNPLVFKDKSSDSNLYTNEPSITVEVSFTADSASGLKTVTLGGASFPAGGAGLSVYVGSVSTTNLLASTAYSVNGPSITFDKVYMNEHTLIFKGVNLDDGEEGSRNISATLTDTTGWISASATSNTITYDITDPTIADGALSWVAEAGNTPGITSETDLNYQKLVIPFTEAIAGVQKVKVEITHDDESTAYGSPFASSSFSISYNDQPLTGSPNGQIYTLNEVKTSGTFTLSNLTLAAASAEGTYHVKVTLIDMAENEQSVSRTINIFKDTTDPVINSIKIIDLQKIEYADNSTTPVKYFAPYETIHEDASGSKFADTLTLEYNVTEAATGVKEIALGGTTVLTDSSRLQKQNASGEWENFEASLVTYSVSDNKISIAQYDDEAYLKGTNIKFRITNVKFTNAGATVSNTISSTLKDFVNLTSDAKTNFTYENGSSTSSVDNVYVDVAAPEFAATNPLVLKDFDSGSNLYTNDSSITVEVSFTADSASGLKTVTLTGASFPESGTDLSVYVDSVSSANLLASTAYSVNGSSITFEKVYINDHKLIFNGVVLDNGAEGSRNISATIKDTTGWTSASVTSNNIIYDITAPAIAESGENAMSWKATSSEYTDGITSENILAHQNLVIPFTEATAGIKTIKVEITRDDETTVYATPFESTSFGVYYGTSTTALTGSALGTVYTLDTVQTSGTITLKNLAIASAAAEGIYHVKVTLTDIAENEQSVSRTINIYKDTVAAQVTKIEVKGLKKSQEKVVSGTTATTTETRYFLEKDYVRDDFANSDTAPTKVCVYLTINETNTGIKQINLKADSTSTAVLQDSTKVYIVDETLETDVTDKLTFDKTNQIITVTNSSDSASLFKGSDLVLLLENLKFTGYGNTANKISVKAYDVAQNAPSARSTITQGSESITDFYSDSYSPYYETLTIIDRAATGYLKANSNYTNESTVDVRAYLSKEGTGSSGINSFIITSGAHFTSNTTVKVGNSSSAIYAIDGLTFELSISPGSTNYDTITFKSSTDSELYYVIRNHLYFYFTNLEFDDTADGSKSISMSAYDLAGWSSRNTSSSSTTTYGPTSGSIYLDTQAPEWVYTGPRVYENSSKLDSSKVYPKSNEAYGVTVNSNLKNKDGNIVTYFYSNAKGKDASTLRGSTINGVLLEIYGKDDQALHCGSNGRTHYYYYYHLSTDTIANIDAEYVLTHSEISSGSDIPVAGKGINPEYDAKDAWLSTSSSSMITSKALYQYFPVGGTYSIVIADKAGNYSPAYTITVVEDGTEPSVKLSDNSTSIADVVTYENDDVNSASKMIKNGVEERGFSWGEDYGGSQTINSDKFLLADSINKIRIRLGSTLSSTDVLINKATHGNKTDNYGEINPDASQSGLQAYAVTVAYNGYLEEDYALGPDSTTIVTTSNYGTSYATLPKWRLYTIPASTSAQVTYADGILYSYVDTNGDIIVQIPKGVYVPVITLFLMDNCGNINKKFLNYSTDSSPYFMYVDNLLGVNTITATSTNHVIQCPVSYRDSSSEDFVFRIENYMNVSNGTSYHYKAGSRTSSYRYNDSSTSLPYNSRLGEIVRDLTKGVNYYTNKAVMLLALPDEQYSCSSSSYGISTANPSFNASTCNYSMKSKLLAVPVSASAPTYNDFATITDSRASEWTYCLWSGSDSGNLNTGHSYPQVDYDDLGWDKTVPYYIYYIVEDAVGNYKIGKVVNSLSDSAMDKWLYDNEGPEISVKKGNTSVSPATITGADINYLVPPNNGYRPYYDGTTGWVWSSISDRSNNFDSSIYEGTGVSTTSMTGGYIYNPAFNISVSEATGVRAFHYSTDPDAPKVRAWMPDGAGEEDNSEDGDAKFGVIAGNKWFAGYGVDGTFREIGSSGTGYTNGSGYINGSGTFTISNYVNNCAYDTETYGNTYSGTKVCRIFPVDLVNDTSSKDIYLYVMDWAGNVSQTKLGNFKWKKDVTAPGISTTPSDIASSQTNYYMEYDSANTRVKLQIAGVGKSTDSEDIKVYVPTYTSSHTTGWHMDTGTGIAGFVYGGTDSGKVSDVLSDTNGKYFRLSYSDYAGWGATLPTTTTGTYVVYDNVGNCSTIDFVGAKDDVAPALHPKIFAGTKTTSTMLYKEGAASSSTSATEAAVSDDGLVSKDVGATDFTCSTYYVKGSSVYFKPYISTPSETGLKFYLAGWSSSTSTWSDIAIIDYDYSSDTYDSISVNLTNGGYYRLSIADQVGNSRFAYFQLYQDITGPVFASTPTVTSTTGDELYTKNSKKYHNGLKISLDSSDAGSGIDKYNINFTYDDDTTATSTGIYDTSVTYTPNATKEYGLDTVIKVTTSDKLGNVSEVQDLGTFVYDNQAPEFDFANSSNKAWTVWEGWVSGHKYEREANVSIFASAGDTDSSHYNFLITDTSTSKVQFTPKATDPVSGVKGWYESESSTKPETIADSDLHTSFTHYTSTDGTKEITLSSTDTNVKKVYYYYAVDNVGNIADSIQVTYKYSSYGAPTVTSWDFGSNTILSHITDTTDNTDKNYYNTLDLVFNVKLEGIDSDNETYAPTGLLFILDEDYSKQGSYLATTSWINVDPNGDGTYTITASLPESLTFNVVNDSSEVTSSEVISIDNHSIGVHVYNSYSYSTCQQIVYEDTAKFEKDTTGPVASAENISVNADTTGQYLSGNDIFFKSGNENVSLTVSGASDQAGIWSYAIVPASNTNPTCPASAMEGESGSLTLQVAAPTKNTQYTLYVWDKVKNRSTIGTYTLKPDGAITGINVDSASDPEPRRTVSVSRSGTEGSVYRASADSTVVWFKGSPVVSVSASLIDSDIAYCYYDSDDEGKRGTIDGSTATFAITPTEDEENHSFYLVDKVGNVSEGYTLTFKRDETAPSVPVVKFTSLTNIVTLSEGTTYTALTEDSEDAGKATVTEDTLYYYNGNTYSSGLPLKAASSDEEGSGLSGLKVHIEGTDDYSFDYAENTGIYTSVANTSENSVVAVTVNAYDNLGNVSTFVFNLFNDSTLPAPTSVGGAPNYGGAEEANVQFNYGSGAVAIKGVTNTDSSYTCTLDEGKTLFTMYDNAIGKDYATNAYVGNISFTLKVSDDIVAYSFVSGTRALTASTVSWTAISPDENGAITVSPATHNTGFHQFYFIWLKDRVGNVAVYNLGKPGASGENWWIQSSPTTAPTFNVIIADGPQYDNYWGNKENNVVIKVNTWSVDIILGNLSPTAAIETLEFDGYKIFGDKCRFVDAYFNESFKFYYTVTTDDGTTTTKSYIATYVAKDSQDDEDPSGNTVTCTLASNDSASADTEGHEGYQTYGNFKIEFSKPYIHADGKMVIHFDIQKKDDTTLATDNGVLKVKDGVDGDGNITYVDINSKFHFVKFKEAGHAVIEGTSVVAADTNLARNLAPASGNFFTKTVSSAVSFVAQKTKTLFTRKPASKEKITSVNSKNFGSFLSKEQKNTSQSVINTDNIISNEKVLSAGSASAALIDSSVAESSESIQVMQASPIDSSISQPKASITSVGESEGQLAEPSSSGKAPVILAIILSLVFIGTLLVIVRHNVDKRKTSKI